MPVEVTRGGIERLELVDQDGDRLRIEPIGDVDAELVASTRSGLVVAVNATADELRELAGALSELADQLDPDS